ncbi:DUF488 family protein [Nocardia brasiliensis]|uniref:DUF488 domain-containing protein n=1 Tax=Nocardia brasiliensis TaxID=37326 RepID=UPI0036736252
MAHGDRVSLFTVGHGIIPGAEFEDLLVSAGIGLIADVRAVPRSRRHPQFTGTTMQKWLGDVSIKYEWAEGLGGKGRDPDPDSVNTALRHQGLRAYADYMRTPPFWHALDDVLREAASRRTRPTSVWRILPDAARVVARRCSRGMRHERMFVQEWKVVADVE